MSKEHQGICLVDIPTAREQIVKIQCCLQGRDVLTAVGIIWQDKDRLLSRLQKRIEKLANTSKLERELEATQNSYSELLGRQRLYMEENTRIIQDQAEYNRRFLEMEKEANAAEKRVRQLEQQILEHSGKAGRLRRCLKALQSYEGEVKQFDENLWNTLVESATISSDRTITFHFYDETDISVKFPEKPAK